MKKATNDTVAVVLAEFGRSISVYVGAGDSLHEIYAKAKLAFGITDSSAIGKRKSFREALIKAGIAAGAREKRVKDVVSGLMVADGLALRASGGGEKVSPEKAATVAMLVEFVRLKLPEADDDEIASLFRTAANSMKKSTPAPKAAAPVAPVAPAAAPDVATIVAAVMAAMAKK